MKKTTTILTVILLAAVSMTAQNQVLSYSAVVRNADNQLIVNQYVTVDISISNSEFGVPVYTETHTKITNQNGLVELPIGAGENPVGSLANVDWKTAYITTTFTLLGGSVVTSKSPVNAVPYALYADNVGNVNQVNANWTETDESDPSFIEHKPNLADVATTGNYNSLSDKPDINNGTLTITLPDGTNKTFTANQSDDETVTIPAAEPMSAAELIALVNSMTEEQKAALRDMLGLTGGGSDPAAFTCGTSTVSDHEGNVYNTVQIGTQCWTKENMRCTTSPSTGTYIVNNTSNHTYTGKMAKWYNNDSATYAPQNYGLLYNWNAAVDTFNENYGETYVNDNPANAVTVVFYAPRRGICPEGWHIPSDAEWTVLTDYVSANLACGNNSANNAKALASTTDDWNNESGECYPGDQSVYPNDDSGFGALPAGECGGSGYRNFGDEAIFWSSTQYLSSVQNNSNFAYNRFLYFSYANVFSNCNGKSNEFSVRCLRDE